MEGSVRKRGKKWYYSFETKTIDGKRKRVERVGGNTKKEAQDKLREELNKIENLEDVKNMNFYQLLDFFLKEKNKTLKKGTEISYKSFSKTIKKNVKDFQLKEINILDFAELKNIDNNLIVFLKIVFNFAFEYGIINLYILGKIKRLKTKKKIKKEKKYFELKEIEENINKIDEDYRGFLLFLFLTGVRAGEAIALEWEDVDFENKTISINKTATLNSTYINSPKTLKSKRIIYMTSKVEKLILNMSDKKDKCLYLLKEEKEGLFKITNKKTDMTLNLIFKSKRNKILRISEISKKIKIISPDLSSHCGRVSHITDLVSNNLPIKAIQDRVGHSKSSITMDIYAKNTKTMNEELNEKLEKL